MKEFDKEYIGKYKDQKAYSYFDSGFVRKILVSKTNEGTKLVLFCSVQGSMSIFKGVLSSLRQFLATENSLKMTKNAFYFTLKALLVLKVIKFLS